jgi:hypothetical protein
MKRAGTRNSSRHAPRAAAILEKVRALLETNGWSTPSRGGRHAERACYNARGGRVNLFLRTSRRIPIENCKMQIDETRPFAESATRVAKSEIQNSKSEISNASLELSPPRFHHCCPALSAY